MDSQRGNNMSDLVLPAIDGNVFNTNSVQASNRMVPRQMSQIQKKNNALISSKLQTTKNLDSIEIKMDKFFRTEDQRIKMSPKAGRESLMSKGERDDMVSNYFTDKKKFK